MPYRTDFQLVLRDPKRPFRFGQLDITLPLVEHQVDGRQPVPDVRGAVRRRRRVVHLPDLERLASGIGERSEGGEAGVPGEVRCPEFARRVADGDLDLDAWCGEPDPDALRTALLGIGGWRRDLRGEPPPNAARSLRRDPLLPEQRGAGVPGCLAQGGAEGGRACGGETVRSLGQVLFTWRTSSSGCWEKELRGHRRSTGRGSVGGNLL